MQRKEQYDGKENHEACVGDVVYKNAYEERGYCGGEEQC